MNTLQQYNEVIAKCKDIFIKKTADYGTSWRVMRTISVVDQIFIKAQRIRTIQEKKIQKVNESIESEFIAIVNYGVIGLIQLLIANDDFSELSINETEKYYTQVIDTTKQLMLNKNHDYGEAWRNMSQEGLVDLILMKLLRMRQIISNNGQTIISENLDANFYDIVNYAVFSLILIKE